MSRGIVKRTLWITIVCPLILFNLTGILHAQQKGCTPNANQVALFEHSHYGGRCVVKDIGTYPSSEDKGWQAQYIGLSNDSISSIKVGANVRAVLFEHDAYQGNCEEFITDDPDLSNNRIGNDRVSSLVVSPRLLVSLPESIYNEGRSGERDRDLDGLKDDLEGVLAEQFKPYLRFDRDERWRRANEPITLFQVRPLGCAGRSCPQPTKVAIRWSFLFLQDGGYGPGTGICQGENAHMGDNDHVTYVLSSSDIGRTWQLIEVHLGGNLPGLDGTIIWPHPQRSPGGTHAECLESIGVHPVIYLSTGKHHMFFHRGDWKDSPYSHVPYWDDCGDDVDGDGELVRPDLHSVGLPSSRYNNVGEPEAHNPQWFVNDLSRFFPSNMCPGGQNAWSDQKFCGGASPMQHIWLGVHAPTGQGAGGGRGAEKTGWPPKRMK